MANRSTPTSPSRPTTESSPRQADPERTTTTLRIRLTRRPDGAVVFELRRPDGTTTWQKRTGPTAEFFAIHDLTHYAVESALGFRHGFYGLVADGWDLGDFGTPWPRGPLPEEAAVVEVIVGCFDAQRAAHEPLTAAQCTSSIRSYFSPHPAATVRAVTDEDLARVRQLLGDQLWRWHATPGGGTHELSFARPGEAMR